MGSGRSRCCFSRSAALARTQDDCDRRAIQMSTIASRIGPSETANEDGPAMLIQRSISTRRVGASENANEDGQPAVLTQRSISARRVVASDTAREDGGWACPTCTFLNPLGCNLCQTCWHCPQCTFGNVCATEVCVKCGSHNQPAVPRSVTPHSPDPCAKRWNCPECNSSNVYATEVCSTCGFKPRWFRCFLEDCGRRTLNPVRLRDPESPPEYVACCLAHMVRVESEWFDTKEEQQREEAALRCS